LTDFSPRPGLASGDFLGKMTLIEMQNRPATMVVQSLTVLHEVTAVR
jgi:hypothetical protein